LLDSLLQETTMTTLSKEDYLKRYLSNDAPDKKKKKKKKDKKVAKIQPRMRIIDLDADVPPNFEPETVIGSDDEDEDLELKPVIANVEDDRPEEVKVFEEFKKSGRWRTMEGDDLTQKHIVEDLIKLEVKAEPEDDYPTNRHKQKKKKKKKIKLDRNGVEIKEEPLSPGRIKTEVDSDTSPPRKRHDSDASPPRKRHDSDASSPRKRHDSDASPPRKRHDSDASPPRKRHDSDASPPRKRHDSDASPPRKSRKHGSDSDNSPPRKKRRDSDASPPRQNRADSDASPPRRGGGNDSDASPPRKSDKMSKTLDGKRAGLQRAGDLKTELEEIRRKEARMFDKMDSSVSGRFAETKVRGRLAEAEEKKRLEAEKKEVPDHIKEKFKQWNKGVKQVKSSMAMLEDNLYEMSKPLTRTENDVDRETLLKEQEREEDPMLKYIQKKKEKSLGRVKKLPKYTGPQPPANRFGIWPGYRWDGVVRTNGFETKLLTKDIKKNLEENEAYKWSYGDGDG